MTMMMKPPPKSAAVDDDAVWLPDYFVPGPRDVVCGWARQHHRHPGNQRFRQLVEYSAPLYMEAKTKVEKTQVIASVVQKVRRDSPCGGFIKRDFHSNRYYEIGDDKARDKVGHAIRRVIEENKKKSKKASKLLGKKAKAIKKLPTSKADFSLTMGDLSSGSLDAFSAIGMGNNGGANNNSASNGNGSGNSRINVNTATTAAAANAAAAASASGSTSLSGNGNAGTMNPTNGNFGNFGNMGNNLNMNMNAINNMNGIGSGTNNNNSNANNGSIGNSQEEANFMGGMKLSLGLSLGDDDQNLLNAFLEQRDSTMAKGLMGTSSFPSNNQRHLPVNLNTDSNKLSQLGGGGHFMQQNMFLPSSGLMNQNNQPSPLDLFSLQSGSIGTNNMLMSQQNMMKQMPSIIANSNLPMNSAINNGPSIFSSNAAAAAAASGNGNQFLGGGHDSSQATASLLLNSLENNPGAFKGLSAQQTNQLRNFGF